MNDDLSCIESANDGDPAGFEALYLRYRDWVYDLAWRLTGSREDALDVLQDTFMYVLKKFPGFKLTSSFKTFLYPVVKNIAIDHCRRKARLKITSVDPDTVQVTEKPESELAVIVKNLPEEMREIILMRFVDDMSIDEIASALKIPAGTVKSRLHRALEQIRQNPAACRYLQGD
jgi:RNA polymerase sigma-70 factor (ECF subfamily)